MPPDPAAPSLVFLDAPGPAPGEWWCTPVGWAPDPSSGPAGAAYRDGRWVGPDGRVAAGLLAADPLPPPVPLPDDWPVRVAAEGLPHLQAALAVASLCVAEPG